MKIKKLIVLVLIWLWSFFNISNIFFLLLFFMILFAIIGLSIWMGRLYYRCRVENQPTVEGTFPVAKGFEHLLCGGEVTCPRNTACLSSYSFFPTMLNNTYLDSEVNIRELNYGITNFDNIFSSMLVVFMATTGEAWSSVMLIMMNGYNYYISAVYFFLCGGLFHRLLLYLLRMSSTLVFYHLLSN